MAVDIAAHAATATARTAHHEAGHAVAAVARDGYVTRIHLGHVDWTTDDPSGDRNGETHHASTPRNQPFVTFAGPWAEARWEMARDPQLQLRTALELAWDANGDGDQAKYDAVVERLQATAEALGLAPIGAAWESDWCEELDELWPAVVAVAQLLIDGLDVGHSHVFAAVTACMVPDTNQEEGNS